MPPSRRDARLAVAVDEPPRAGRRGAFCYEAFCYRCDEMFYVCFSKRDG
jgi:hypothetical protein